MFDDFLPAIVAVALLAGAFLYAFLSDPCRVRTREAAVTTEADSDSRIDPRNRSRV